MFITAGSGQWATTTHVETVARSAEPRSANFALTKRQHRAALDRAGEGTRPYAVSGDAARARTLAPTSSWLRIGILVRPL